MLRVKTCRLFHLLLVEQTENTLNNIIRRWLCIFEESSSQDSRIVGFSTDADSRYLLAMRFVSVFSTLLNSSTAAHPLSLEVIISPSWSWFYSSSEQLFFCMRNAIHICTKLRNLFSLSSAIIIINSNIIWSNRVYVLVTNKNFRSFERLCTSLECLKEINGLHAAVIHASIIRCVILAFIDTSTTTTSDRIYRNWVTVFLRRLWRT